MATLSQAQIEARRKGGLTRAKSFTREYQQAARQALADKVDISYWRFIGCIGRTQGFIAIWLQMAHLSKQ